MASKDKTAVIFLSPDTVGSTGQTIKYGTVDNKGKTTTSIKESSSNSSKESCMSLSMIQMPVNNKTNSIK